jgi:Fe2+ transport system protein FeoA
MPENPKTVSLSKMLIGQKGLIRKFVVESDDCERIEEMGVTPGEHVEVVRYAPLGDPVEIKIRGYHLSLRKEEAELIQVEVIP